jgi:hypothetical protein
MADAVNHYVSVALGAWLIAWTLDLLLRDRPRPVAAGLVAGACALTRPEMTLAAPLLAWIAATGAPGGAGAAPERPRPWPAAIGFLLAFAAISGWWWIERWRALGTPFFNLTSYLSISFSAAHPGDALFRDFSATPGRFAALFADALPTLPQKWAHFLPRAAKRLLTTPCAALGWLLPFGALAARRAMGGAMPALAALALIPAVAITLLGSVRLYPVPFLAVYAIAAALGLRWLVERLPRWAHRPRVWLTLLLLAALPAGAVELYQQEAQARGLERRLAEERAALAAVAAAPGTPPRPMFSDTPDFVAWTTRRPAVWLTRAELERLLAEPARRPSGWPDSVRAEDTWFHRTDPRHPETTRGEPLRR